MINYYLFLGNSFRLVISESILKIRNFIVYRKINELDGLTHNLRLEKDESSPVMISYVMNR